jgi:hypothetical protein
LADAEPLHHLLKASLHAPKFLDKLIVLECQSHDLFFRLSLLVDGLLVVSLVDLDAGFQLCGLAFVSHVLLMNFVYFFHVAL